MKTYEDTTEKKLIHRYAIFMILRQHIFVEDNICKQKGLHYMTEIIVWLIQTIA